MPQMQLPGFGGRRTPNKTRIPGYGTRQMQLPGFEAAGVPATRSASSIPKRRAMGGPTARVSNQPFLPGFNPRNAPGSAMDARRTIMTPKRMAGVDAARSSRAVSHVPKSGSGIDLSRFAGNLTEESFPAAKKPLMSMFGNMTRGKKVGIGLGLAVAAGVAMNRRGKGVSPGRQSNARY